MKSTEANTLREQSNKAQLKIKELEHNISKHRKESQDAADKVNASVDFPFCPAAAGIYCLPDSYDVTHLCFPFSFLPGVSHAERT